MLNHQKASHYTSLFVFLAAISAISFGIQRHETTGLMMAYFTAFFCYLWIVKMENNPNLLFGLGVITRLILFFHLPSLSDDVYRFLWDGQLIAKGINPYPHLPSELLNESGIDKHLFTLLNSQEHFTIYPSLNQALFWLAWLAGQGNYLMGTNFLRLILLFGEIGSYFLLQKLTEKDHRIAHWYFLNPLVILEIVGNIHFEGLVIFFMLLGLYALKKNKYAWSGLGFGLAATTKLIPLIMLPFLLFRHKWKSGITLVTIAGSVFILSFLLLDSTDLLAMLSSAQLYMNKFEFNASIYYLLREVGFFWKGYNIIQTLGPWLAVVTFLSIVTISIIAGLRKWSIPTSLLFIFSIYLLFGMTIHPWYVLTLLPLGLLAGYYYPLVWTFLVFSTYVGYHETGYSLPVFWIVFEYVIVFAIASIEIYRKNLMDKHE